MERVTHADMGNAINMLLNLFFTFAKIGAFTFGGGYAMIPLIENICVEQKQWITHAEMMDVTVIAETTPGPIAINCATYVGYKQKEILGAIAATFGVILPSFIIIYLISVCLNSFLEISWIKNAFKGIRIAVGILILDAGINMFIKMKKKVIPCAIMGCSFLAVVLISIFGLNFSSILLMFIAGVVSLVMFLIEGEPSEKGGAKQ